MKKLLALMLTAILLFGCFSAMTVSAAKTPTFVVSSAKGEAGDTVKITVSTKNNSGIISMKLLIGYDSKALEIVDVEGGKFKNTAYSPTNSNPFIVNWVDSIHPNNKTNGAVATISFKILDTAPEGKSEITLDFNPDDVFDLDFNNVTFGVQNGYVDITNKNAQSKPAESSQPEDEAASNQTTSDDVVNNENDGDNHNHDHDNSTSSIGSDAVDGSTSGDKMVDTTTSAILEQIYSSANQESVTQSDVSNTTTTGTTNDKSENENNWIIWVVVAAVVLLAGAFAVVIIKGKKEE